MKIAVPKETKPGERRAALVPESARRLAAQGLTVAIEAGTGEGAGIPDDDYRSAGAAVEADLAGLLASADLVIRIHPPTPAEVAALRPGSALISLLYPLVHPELVQLLAARAITAFATDQIPRTTLAQSMDVLTSQSTAAGYRAVILAAHALPKLFFMLMTAAGTLAPARVLILGAGVAGLQAIAVARRLGAIVEAFDVRAAVREQIESLGARFVELGLVEDAETAGGYARELSDATQRRQREVIGEHLARTDACITTALIPGKRAPVLVTEAMVRQMRPGSVIVDLAAEQGGNCEVTVPGRTVLHHGVTVLGPVDPAADVAVHASQMLSRNMEKLVLHLARDGRLTLDLNDEITRGVLVTHEGRVVAPLLPRLVAPSARPA
jgi:NAD(P) transhydrogenase subunit alpha